MDYPGRRLCKVHRAGSVPRDAQKILAARKERCTESSMLEALRKLWKEKGTLNAEDY